MPGATRTIVVQAPIERVWDVISDYERYPTFMREVKGIKVKRLGDTSAEVEYEVSIIKTIRYTIRMAEQKPSHLSWTWVGGEIMKDNKGSWTLKDLGGNSTEVTYNVDVAVGMLVPKAVIDTLVDANLPAMLDAVKRRVESSRA